MRKTLLLASLLTLGSMGIIDSSTLNKPSVMAELQFERQLEKERKQQQHHEDELNRFLNDVGFRESGNRYTITNKWGYMGKYQFGRSTLKGLGLKVTKEEFLNNPQLQEEAMMALLLHNKEKLQKYIDVFDGQTINGMYISESGILAAAHLGGQGSVKRFFKNGKVFKDGNGTKITSYMHKFSGYNIKLKPNS